MSDSTNLALPYLRSAQAQKHVTVNESLRKLDALVLLAVEDKDLTAPPGSPADGARYIPKTTATGLWSGKENYVAHYVDGAWEFYAPREGFTAYVRDENLIYVYDGATWTLPGREQLTANRTYYVRTDGSDSNTGLANNSGGAFLTIQKAIDVAAALDSSIYDVTIQLAAGTYAATGLIAKTMVGAGRIIVVGDETTPANVILNTTNSGGIGLNSTNVQTTYEIRGVKMSLTGGGNGFCLMASFGSVVKFQNIDVGSGWSQQLRVTDGGIMQATGNYTISSGATSCHVASVTACIRIEARTVTLTGTPAFATFAIAANLGAIYIDNNTFSGSATGARYSATTNGLIATNGAGATYLPGSSAGSTATGGQYA